MNDSRKRLSIVCVCFIFSALLGISGVLFGNRYMASESAESPAEGAQKEKSASSPRIILTPPPFDGEETIMSPYRNPGRLYGLHYTSKRLGLLFLHDLPRELQIDGKEVPSRLRGPADESLPLAIENDEIARVFFSSPAPFAEMDAESGMMKRFFRSSSEGEADLKRLCRQISQGGYEKAISEILSLIESGKVSYASDKPESSVRFRNCLYLLGAAYELNGNFPEALEVYAALYGEGSSEYYWAQARILYATDNAPDALQFLLFGVFNGLSQQLKDTLTAREPSESDSRVSLESVSDVHVRSELWKLRASCIQFICPEFFFVTTLPDSPSANPTPQSFDALAESSFRSFLNFMESESNKSGWAAPLLRALDAFSYETTPDSLRKTLCTERYEFPSNVKLRKSSVPPRLRYDVPNFAPLPIENSFIAGSYHCYSPGNKGGFFVESRSELLVPLARGQYDKTASKARKLLKEYSPWKEVSAEAPPTFVFTRGSLFRKTLILLAASLELEGEWKKALSVYSALYDQESVEYLWASARILYGAGAYGEAYRVCLAAIDVSMSRCNSFALKGLQERGEGDSLDSETPEYLQTTLWQLRDCCARVVCPELHYASRLSYIWYEGMAESQKTLDDLQHESFDKFCSFMTTESGKKSSSGAPNEALTSETTKLLEALAKAPYGFVVLESGMGGGMRGTQNR